MTKQKKIDLPSVLSFERKLEVSDALMFSGNWGEDNSWLPVEVIKRKNRSTQAAFGTEDSKKPEANPVSSDSDDANLFNDHNTLKVNFTMRVIGNVGEPFACNDPDFETPFTAQVNVEKEKSLHELAYRYAHNIASGRFLWRNRVNAEKVQVSIKVFEETINFENSFEFPFNNFDVQRDNVKLQKVVQAIFEGLNSKKDDNKFVLLNVTALVLLGNGQHVFPSQEMNIGEKKKVLFQLNKCAALHSVKAVSYTHLTLPTTPYV